MRIRVSVPEEQVSPNVVNAALEAVTRLDEQLIRGGQSPTATELIGAGAIWKPEPPGDECFDHGGTIATRGWGDCDDWAPLAAAEHRVKGTDPGAKAIVIPSGPNTYHALVQRSDGTLEDPSLAAGMKPLGSSRVSRVSGSEQDGISILACDPHDPSRIYEGSLLPTTSPMSLHCGPQFAVRKATNGCFEGRCDVPVAGGPMAPVRTARVSGAAMPYSLVHQAYAPHPGMAVSHAVQGAIDTANACGFADAGDYVKLQALQGCLQGNDPREVYAHLSGICGPELAHAAVIGAHRIARRWVKRHQRRYHVRGVAHAAVAPTW